MKTYLPHTLTALFLLCCLPAHAQNITLDGTTGPHPGQIQPLTGPNYTIDATQGTTLGSNLYHSFQTFNLFQNESATFTGPTDIRNVVNRVTGGSSTIDGLLQSTMPNANFYFLNPNGVFFGPHASVNVPNSFYVSSSANPQIGEASALVAAGPAGFQGMPLLTGERAERFGLLDIDVSSLGGEGAKTLGGEGETVTIRGSGSVPSLEVMGNEISLENAKIRAEAEKLSFHSSGSLVINDSEIRSSRPNTVIEMTADNLKINRTTEAGGPTIRMNAGDEDAGQVRLEARTIEMTGNSNNTMPLLDGSSYGTGKAADFRIIANDQFILRDAMIMANTIENAAGKGGTVSILSNNGLVNLSNSSLQATTKGSGRAGNISIFNAKQVDLEKESLIVASTMSSGDGGVISINTGTLNVEKSAIAVGTLGTGKGGNLNIQATQSITLSGASGWSSSRQPQPSSPPESIPLFTIAVDSRNESSGGDATNGQPVVIETPHLELNNGAVISLATFGQGQGGNLEIRADNISVTDSNIVSGTAASGQGGNIDIYTNALTLSGEPRELLPEFLPDRVFSSIELSTIGDGNAGNLRIEPKSGTPPTINILDGASISSSSNSTSGSGKAGGLIMNAGTVNLNRGTVMAKTVGLGEGGKIRITANQVALDNESEIDVETTGSNKAGSLSITATREVSLNGNSSITASTEGKGEGGAISLTVNSGNLNVNNQSSISASTKGEKDAGRLGITANEVNLTDNSLINAATFGKGRGGDLNVEANKLSVTNSNIIAATGTGGGEAGKVEIRTADMNLSGYGTHPDLPPRGEPYATLEVSTAGYGNAGDLTIGPKSGGYRPTLTLDNNASISASTLAGSSGKAGNLTITANQVSLDNSTIKSSTAGQGQGGNLTMTASNVFLNNGASLSAKADREAAGNAGSISIEATGGVVSANEGSQIITESYQSQGGSINITASDLSVTNRSEVNANVKDNASQEASINLNVNSLTLNDNSRLTSSTSGNSQSGTITVQAQNAVSIADNSKIASETTGGSGNAGQINVSTPQLSLANHGEISTTSSAQASGHSGSITLNNINHLVMGDQSALTAQSQGSGNAGNIRVNSSGQKAELVSLNNASNITTEAQYGAGGSIEVNAQHLSVENNSNITANVEEGSSGALPAKIQLNVNQLRLQEGNIKSSTNGQGPAGNIAITATEYLDLNQGNILSEASGTGRAGEITIGPVPRLTLAGESKISTTANGPSDSGSISIYADEVQVPSDTQILSENFQGYTGGKPANITMKVDRLDLAGEIKSSTHGSSPGGEISITASDYIHVTGGKISSTADASGDAGHIKIGNESQWVPTMTVTDSGEVSATALGSSSSGTVTLFVNNLQADKGSIKSASGSQGSSNATPAEVKVTTENVTLANGSEIKTSTEGASPAGSVTVIANQTVDISNSNVVSESTGTGKAGEVIVGEKGKPVRELTLTGGKDNQTMISTTAEGTSESGTITLYVDSLTVKGGASIKSENEKGFENATPANITLDVETLTLGEENKPDSTGKISTRTTGESKAGNITITASEYVEIFGGGGIMSDSVAGAMGNAGKIDITVDGNTDKANALTVNGGKISTNTYGTGLGGDIRVTANNKPIQMTTGGRIESSTENTGDAGNITIQTNVDVNISGNKTGIFSTSGTSKYESQQPTGSAGNVSIIGTEKPIKEKPINLTVTENGRISTTSYEGSKSGNIDVQVDTLSLENGGRIESSNESKNTGNNPTEGVPWGSIKVAATSDVTISGTGSGIFSTVGQENKEAIGLAGDIYIAKNSSRSEALPQLTVKDDGKVSTTAHSGIGKGRIYAHVENLTLENGGRIESSNESPEKDSSAGQIQIQATAGVTISGKENETDDKKQSGVFSTVEEKSPGKAGKVVIAATVQTTKDIELLTKDIELLTPVPQVKIEKRGKVSTTSKGSGQGGEIQVSANKLDLQTKGRIESSTKGSGNAGVISITASDYIAVSGVNLAITEEQSGIFSTTSGNGNAGTITIGKDKPVPTITLSNEGQISTATTSQGQGGTMEIKADQLAVNSGGVITAKVRDVASQEDKSTANIDVTVTNKLSLQGGGRIESSTTGTRGAGTITVTANQVEVSGQSPDKSKHSGILSTSGENVTGVTGDAGTITIGKSEQRVSTINLSDNGQISTQSFQQGKGGEINLYAQDLTVTNGNINAKVKEGQDPDPTKSTANINVTVTNQLSLQGGGRIESSSTGTRGAGTITVDAKQIDIFGAIESSATAQGNAGRITISATDYLALTAGKISTSATGQGDGGNITLISPHLRLSGQRVSEKEVNQAKILATKTGEAPAGKTPLAGNIDIRVDKLDMSDTTISTEATKAKGGNISIDVKDIPTRRIKDSTISATVTEGQGEGGNVTITSQPKPKRLYLDNTDVIAKADEGKGGALYIKPEVYIASADSEVSASSEKGIDGEVQTGMTVDIGSLSLFSRNPVDASKLIKDCTAVAIGEEWSLVPVGLKTRRTETSQLPPVQEGLRLSLYSVEARQNGGCLR